MTLPCTTFLRIRTLRLSPILVLIFITNWSGCTHRKPTPDTTSIESVEDDLGRTVRVSVPSRRIMTLAPSVTEIIFAAGGFSSLVGVTTADDYPAAVRDLPAISALPVNHEAIVRLEPDLIFASTDVNNPRDAILLSDLGIPTYFLRTRSLDDILRNLRIVGKLVGTQLAANWAADSLEARISLLHSLTDTLTSRPRVLVLISANSLASFGAGSYIHDLVRLAGGLSISQMIELEAPILSSEFVIAENPDFIIGSFHQGVGAAELLRLHPEWTSVRAIKTGSVFPIEPDLILRPGPRAVEGSWRMLGILHPELAETLR